MDSVVVTHVVVVSGIVVVTVVVVSGIEEVVDV